MKGIRKSNRVSQLGKFAEVLADPSSFNGTGRFKHPLRHLYNF